MVRVSVISSLRRSELTHYWWKARIQNFKKFILHFICLIRPPARKFPFICELLSSLTKIYILDQLTSASFIHSKSPESNLGIDNDSKRYSRWFRYWMQHFLLIINIMCPYGEINSVLICWLLSHKYNYTLEMWLHVMK